jgi:TPP-dependent pyruvate/acetoin dehydrogenase alpha subunit
MKNPSTEEALRVYEKLSLARLCEEKIREIYHLNELKTPVHLGVGAEAIGVGIHHATVSEGAKYFGTYRNHTIFLAATRNPHAFFAELFGKVTGSCKGKGGSMHLMSPEDGLVATSAVVATTIPVAVGCALAQQYRNSQALAVVFFGDGAMEEGVFWESLNFACLKRLPVLFVCEDNQLAIHSPIGNRQGFRSVENSLGSFDLAYSSGEGRDVFDVMNQTTTIVDRMRRDKQPGFLHLSYFRFLEHVGIGEDFTAGYRKKPLAKELDAWDPILIARERLSRMGVQSNEVEALEGKIRQNINSAVEQSRRDPFPPPEELMADVLARKMP